jgi:hypothetical protein
MLKGTVNPEEVAALASCTASNGSMSMWQEPEGTDAEVESNNKK